MDEAIDLLKELIRTPSFSGEEGQAADLIRSFWDSKKVSYEKQGHNTWSRNKHFDMEKPSLLLNSHIDTVKPASSSTTDPFEPIVTEGKLEGLGSNDAGASLVSLLFTFLHYNESDDLPFNLIMLASAEEEISGPNGVASLKNLTESCSLAIVGEPTEMKMAIAEKGLMVLDGIVRGISGHAAREEGENAIYKAIADIEWYRTFQFDKVSQTLGPVKMNLTQVHAGSQHNVVPDECRYVVDVRSIPEYSHEEIIEKIQAHTIAEVNARSLRLRPSGIRLDHPLVIAARELGIETFGSSTLSDQALMTIPSVKIGPGNSARSHTAGEFIHMNEIGEGIKTYIRLINQMINTGIDDHE